MSSKYRLLSILMIMLVQTIRISESFTTHQRSIQDMAAYNHHISTRHGIKHHDPNNVEQHPSILQGNMAHAFNRRHNRQQTLNPTEQETIMNIFGPPDSAQRSSLQKRQLAPNYFGQPSLFQSNSPGSQISNNFYPFGTPFYQNFGIPTGFGLVPLVIYVNCPPPQTPTTTTPSTNVSFPNRFNPEEEASWGFVDESSSNTGGGNNVGTGGNTGSTGGNGGNVAQIDFDSYFNTPTGISLEPVRPLRPQSRPLPPIQHGSNAPQNQNRPQSQQPQAQVPAQSRPVNRPPTNQVRRPTNCALAIVDCCSYRLDTQRLQQCFESRRCPGNFFGDPCSSELAKAANEFVKDFQRN